MVDKIVLCCTYCQYLPTIYNKLKPSKKTVHTVTTPFPTRTLKVFEFAEYLVSCGGRQVYLHLISTLFRLAPTRITSFDPISTGNYINRF